jgi:hypothetical protein
LKSQTGTNSSDPQLRASQLFIYNIKYYRFGIQQLRNCYELADTREWQQKPAAVPLAAGSSLLEKRKLAWETERAQQDEKRRRLDTNLDLVTYPSQLAARTWAADDAEGQQQQLVVWRPMAALLDEIHGDMAASLLYQTEMMAEEELPPVHVKKERKGAREQSLAPAVTAVSSSPPPVLATTAVAAIGGFHPLSPAADVGKPKIRRVDEGSGATLLAPKSLFDRPRPLKALVRPRPVGVLGATVGGASSAIGASAVLPTAVTGTASQLQTTASGLLLQGSGGLKAGLVGVATLRDGGAADTSGPDWLIQEDWALHQAVIILQEMPLTLTASSPAQIANWDLVADMVNSVSKCFRSPRQCRHRYETTILPREEGRLMYNDVITATPVLPTPPAKGVKKQKQLQLKHLGVHKTEKTLARPVKTSVLFRQDNNNAWSSQFSSRFETIKAIANKRTPTTKPLLVNPTLRNPKHAAVLSESGVNYDSPLTPVQVAANRAERIQKEKQRNAAAAAAANAVAATQLQQSSQQQGQQQQAVIQGQQQPQQILQQQQAVGQPTRVTVASIAANPLPLNSCSTTINQSAPAQAVVVGISQPMVQQQQQLAQVVAASVGQARSTVVTQAVVTVSGVLSGLTAGTTATVTRLAGGQIVVSQAGKPGVTLATSQAATLQVANRQLNQAQMQALKQQALLKRSQQEQQQLRQKLTLQQHSQQQPTQQQQILGSVVTAGPAVGGVARAVVGSTATVTTLGMPRTGTVVAVTAGHQILRPNVRTMTESEIKAMLAKQQLKVTGPGQVQVQPGAQLSTTQLSTAQLQHLGLQVKCQDPRLLCKC